MDLREFYFQNIKESEYHYGFFDAIKKVNYTYNIFIGEEETQDYWFEMGHSDAGVTLNVYTHASYAHAAEQMAQISQFRQGHEADKNKDLTAVWTADMVVIS